MTAKTDKPQFVVGQKYRLGDLPEKSRAKHEGALVDFYIRWSREVVRTVFDDGIWVDSVPETIVTLASLPADQVEAESKPCPGCDACNHPDYNAPCADHNTLLVELAKAQDAEGGKGGGK